MKTELEKPALISRKLTHRFGDKVALNSLDLSIPSSGVTALLGANGAGKTTLINCALGLCKPSSGSITVFGRTPGEIDTKHLVGVMLQDSNLPDLLTAREQIELFRSYYRHPLSSDEVIVRCDLGHFVDQRYKKLSGGQKRRVQFALAIIGQPKIVFLDEPTTGLDIGARKIVWNTINELSDSGTAVVLSTHYLEEAESLADHTIVMHQGELVANDSTNNIRAMASGAVIRCETRLDINSLLAINHVQAAQIVGRKTEIRTDNATASLRLLLQADSNLSNLTVSKSSLEDAFIQLSQSQDTGQTQHRDTPTGENQ